MYLVSSVPLQRLTGCFYHVTFKSESTLCSCLNVKERLVQNRPALLNGWLFFHELSGCGVESHYSRMFRQLLKWENKALETSGKNFLSRFKQGAATQPWKLLINVNGTKY